MKLFKIALVVLMFLINVLAIAQPSLADRIAKKSLDYPQVTQALAALSKVKADPTQSQYTAEELQQKTADLQLQKYILETSEDWGTCRNETGKTLAIYAHKPKSAGTNTLYYLGNGKTTDDDWDCDGVLLPNDAKVAGFNLTAGEPAALKILDGTQLVATTNPDTEEVELNTPLALTKILNVGEANWLIPNLAQADIDAQKPNAPIDD